MRSFLILFCALSLTASAQINNWTKTASGNWEDPANWSLGLRPAANQTITIANSGYKAVGISSSTVANFPAALTINNLSISGPTDALNTLLLNYAGTGIPLRVLNACSVGSNATLLNLYSSLQVDGSSAAGFVVSNGGQFIEEGGFSHITPLVKLQNGTLSVTNAALTLGGLQLGDLTSFQNGIVNQSGGTLLASNIYVDRGDYELMGNGTIYALNGTSLRSTEAQFHQWSGSNYGDIFLSRGYYYMNGGLAHGNYLSTDGHSEFYQSAGTVEYSLMEIGGPPYPSQGSLYLLQNGVVRCGTLSIKNAGTFQQSGGTCLLSNSVHVLDDSVFVKTDGDLFMPSLVVSNLGYFGQSGGATHVAGDISFYTGDLSYDGGTLSSMNFGLAAGVYFPQHGGTNEVKGVLSVSGQYDLVGGKLSANGIYLRGGLNVFANVQLINSGTMNLGGGLSFSSSQNALGPVTLATNSMLTAGGSSIILHFADSSALNWNSNSILIIRNSDSFSGNGDHQIYFGNNASGLTAAQVAKIRFEINVSGLPLGYYPARILPTGEVVPVQQTPSIFVIGHTEDYYGFFYPGGLIHDVIGLSVRHQRNIALRANGSVITWPSSIAWTDPTATNFVGVAAGGDFFLALTANGSVSAWGENFQGQTSVPSGLNNAIAVAAGQTHAIALRTNNTIVGWGANDDGQLNIPASASTAIAISAGDYHNLALRSDNNVVAWGRNVEGQCNVPPSLSDVVAIAGGGYFSMALKSNGRVVCWGANESGQCNVPVGLSNVVAIAAGYDHALALRTNGVLVAWGNNSIGQTNIPPWATNIVQIAAGDGYAQVVPGGGTRLHARLTQPKLIPSAFDPSARWFTLSAPSRSGQVLRLEYTDGLTQPNWKPLPLTAGRAGTTTLYDFNPTASSRNYRVKQW